MPVAKGRFQGLTYQHGIAHLKSVREELALEITCKHTGKTHRYDFSEFERCPSIAKAFAGAFWGRRNDVGHNTRYGFISKGLRCFYTFLDATKDTHQPIGELSQLTYAQFERYGVWLQHQAGTAYQTKAQKFYSLSEWLEWIRRNISGAPADMALPPNFFPGSVRMVEPSQPYSSRELTSLLLAVSDALRKQELLFEKPYEPRYLGKPEPTVIPAESIRWRNIDNLTWYWENFLSPWKTADISQAPVVKGTFQRSIGLDFGNMAAFKKAIGVDADYQPRWLNKPLPRPDLPVMLEKVWHREYCIWYFENKMLCRAIASTDPEAAQHSAFLKHISKNCGTREFYERLGVSPRIETGNLLPYMLMLAIRTGINLQPLLDLRADCLVPDPLVPERMTIRWHKIRAEKTNLQSHSAVEDDQPVRIIERVLAITAAIRARAPQAIAQYLWLTDHREPKRVCEVPMRGAIYNMIREYELTGDDGTPLQVGLKRLRATAALKVYLKNNNIFEVKQFLHHAHLQTTVGYLDNMDIPELAHKMKLHQDAMVGAFTAEGQTGSAGMRLAEQFGVDLSHADALAQGAYDSFFGRCRNPFSSPHANERPGHLCTRMFGCFTCRNLVVFPEDLHKIFSFKRHILAKLAAGEVTQSQFDKVYAGIFGLIDEQIVPRFPADTVAAMQQKAIDDPYFAWTAATEVLND